MKNGKFLLILSLSFILLIVGASVLYQNLQPAQEPNRLVTLTPPSNDKEDPADTADESGNTTDAPSTEFRDHEHVTDPDDTTEDATASESADEQESTPPSDPTDREPADTKESQPENEEPPAPPYPGYDFTVYDRNGNAVRLSDFVGKPVVLNFWASWCGPCQAEMPEFEKVYQELGNEVHFLMVNLTDGVSETVATASSFIDKNGYSFPVFYDKDSMAATVYDVYSIPTTYFIDAEGNPIAYASGAIGEEIIRTGIDMVR